jgi:putative membrane protein
MTAVAIALILLVAALHLYFMVMETFLWTRPSTRAKFGTTEEFARASATLAANQGIYNFFLAAGLVWSLTHYQTSFFFESASFFLSCVVLAGIFGAATVSRKIFFIQAMPAILALAALWI